MPNYLLTPLMNLHNPVPGVDPGPDYALNLQVSLNTIDQHNHSLGSGNVINPSGLNINTDLPFNSNNATLLRSTRFVSQASPLNLATDLNALYVSNGNLYYNNSTGTQVQITSGSTVNATSSGIASGTATAGFVGGVLVVDSATNTPANIQAGSLLIGNNTAGSNFITLSAPSALASSYSLVLPQIPASPQFVTLDTSGNLSTANSIQGTQIAAASLTGAQLANATITETQMGALSVGTPELINGSVTPTKLAAAAYATGNWSTLSTTSSSYTNLTGGSQTIVNLSGVRPVLISLSTENGPGGGLMVNNPSIQDCQANLRVTVTYGVSTIATYYLTVTEPSNSAGSSGFTGVPIANSWVLPAVFFGSVNTLSVTLALNAVSLSGFTTTAQITPGTLTLTEL